jgi:hypothetical protein
MTLTLVPVSASLLFVFLVHPQAPEYAGYALTEKLFSFRTPQAERAAQAAQAGEDHVKIAEEFAAATKGTGTAESCCNSQVLLLLSFLKCLVHTGLEGLVWTSNTDRSPISASHLLPRKPAFLLTTFTLLNRCRSSKQRPKP